MDESPDSLPAKVLPIPRPDGRKAGPVTPALANLPESAATGKGGSALNFYGSSARVARAAPTGV